MKWELEIRRAERLRVVANVNRNFCKQKTHMASLDTSRKEDLASFLVTSLIKQIKMYNYPHAHEVQENPHCKQKQNMEVNLATVI